MKTLRTVGDARDDRIAADLRQEARALARGRRNHHNRLDLQTAQKQAARLDPRIGVLCIKGKPVFYVVLAGELIKRDNVEAVVSILAEHGGR